MNQMQETLKYYDQNADIFVAGTFEVDMAETRSRFAACLSDHAYFTYFTEETLNEFWENASSLQIFDKWITQDVRPDRKDEKWINLLARRV